MLLLLTACIDNRLNPGGDVKDGFDSGDDFDPGLDSDSGTVGDEVCDGDDNDGDGQVDEDFPDDDGNGRADCMDKECPALDLGHAGTVAVLEECDSGTPVVVTDPWNAAIEWQYTVSSGQGVIVMPAVGNITDDNGDGRVDENDDPDVVFTTWGSNTLVALHGDGTTIFEIPGYDGQGGVTIADVDQDGFPDIVGDTVGHEVFAVDGSGTEIWRSSGFGLSAYPQPTVGDFDGDGDIEVFDDIAVVEGLDGSTVTTLSTSTSWRTAVAADLDQDGDQELIIGNRVFNSDGSAAWNNAGSGAGDFSAVADVDGDPEGEVFFASGNQGYVHDDDGTLLHQFTVPGSNPGPPAIADFDGDGQVEIAVPANTTISVFEVDGTKVWSAPMQDNSGLAGCSGYDVDGDGAYEVLFADEIAFRMYDGKTGTVLYENKNHASGTLWEYPVIADVDNDGSAEIVVADNGGVWKGVTVYGHDGSVGWPKSGTTWATHDFAVTNVDPDGSVPTPPEPSWQVYNVFRARPAVDEPGRPDLTVAITDQCVADCDYGPVSVGVQVGNAGGVDVDAGVVLNLYADDDTGERLVATTTLPEILAGTILDGIQLDLGPGDIGRFGWIARVDETDVYNECDETNNEARYTDSLCP